MSDLASVRTDADASVFLANASLPAFEEREESTIAETIAKIPKVIMISTNEKPLDRHRPCFFILKKENIYYFIVSITE